MEQKQLTLTDKTISYLNPLFWQHGEEEQYLRNEIAKMNENGISDFIVEARPHPDYLGEGWWRDLTILLDEAKKRNMKVWLFDDGSYPSGYANGLIEKKYPQYLKKYIAENHIDATGSMEDSSFLINEWLIDGESVISVIAAKRIDIGDDLDGSTLIDLTSKVINGILYWEVPEGEWRIFIFKKTRYGGEEHTINYLNPLDKEGTAAFIETIYEEHYRHFKDDFGKTIVGFFTDEPRFGNAATYSGTIGKFNMVLPYSDTLIDELSKQGLGDFKKLLPCLWYNAGDITPDVRYAYMDVVSKRFSKNFMGQIGDWCRNHQVKLIGHVVEENGAHARLGYGAGHYFRALEGFDSAGIDIVCNLYPGKTSGKYNSFFNYFDVDFNHYGLSKLASSASHIDPKKNGSTISETFGAYGWTEGLKAMKWITDVICVRGVNIIVPHAFSPAQFPDPDCPPHFYARGQNPQFRSFNVWSDYANRVCHLISDGTHIAPVAVLYHAEAEWGGQYEPFEKTVKTLMQNQIDCDVLPVDIIIDNLSCIMNNKQLEINKEKYKALIIPYAEYLPKSFTDRISEFSKHGLPVIFIKDFPKRCYYNKDCFIEGMVKVDYPDLAKKVWELKLQDIKLSSYEENLSYYHYNKQGKDIFFFVNENIKLAVNTKVRFNINKKAYLYDAMTGKKYNANQVSDEYGCEIELYLEGYQSLFVIFDNSDNLEIMPLRNDFHNELQIVGDWQISIATSEEYPNFKPITLTSLSNISRHDLLPEFSGTIKYEINFESQISTNCMLDLGRVYELADVFINGIKIGTKICPPYLFALDKGILKEGMNSLVVEVTNTLVKSMHNNPFDRYWPQEPSGLLGSVKILF